MSSLPNVNANFTATAPLGKTIHNIYNYIYCIYIIYTNEYSVMYNIRIQL